MRIIFKIAEETKICKTNFIEQVTREVLRINTGYDELKIDFDIEHKESQKLIEEAYKTGILDLRNYKVI